MIDDAFMVILSYPLIILTTSIIGIFIFVNLRYNINMDKRLSKISIKYFDNKWYQDQLHL